MTEDFKTNLQNYLLGKVDDPEEPIVNEPQFQQPTSNSNSIQAQIGEAFGFNYRDWESFTIMGNVKSEQSSFILYYGKTPSYKYNEETGESEAVEQKNFLALFDENSNAKLISSKWVSGSNMVFEYLCLKEENDGKIYGLVRDANGQYSILILNAILREATVGRYQFKLNTNYVSKYSISTSYGTSKSGNNDLISRVSDSGVYYIVGQSNIIKFTVNYGAENEWKEINNSAILSDQYFVYLQKTEKGNVCHIEGLNIDKNGTVKWLHLKLDENDSLSTVNSINLTLEGQLLNVSGVILNENLQYISLYEMIDPENYKNVIYKFTENTYNEIASSTAESYNLYLSNGIVFVEKTLDSGQDTIYFGLIQDDKIYYNSYSQIYGITETKNTIITNKYNLFEIAFDGRIRDGERYTIQLIYNSANYNGREYINPNMLVPNSSVLKDSNGKIIFARNLYNKIIQGPTTSSIVQVPNTLLNDTTINSEELYSLTNNQLLDNNVTINKNIYETLNINFNSTITVLNNNDALNPISMVKTAAYINKNISTEDSAYTTYGNQRITKYRINYSDGTASVNRFQSVSINGLVATITFTLLVDKEIKNIDVLSNDESTIYCTFTGDFEIGKLYNINEDMLIS